VLVQTCRQSHLSVCLSIGQLVGRSVWKVYCGKTADWTWMPFGWWVGSVEGWVCQMGVQIVEVEGVVLDVNVTNGTLWRSYSQPWEVVDFGISCFACECWLLLWQSSDIRFLYVETKTTLREFASFCRCSCCRRPGGAAVSLHLDVILAVTMQ